MRGSKSWPARRSRQYDHQNLEQAENFKNDQDDQDDQDDENH